MHTISVPAYQLSFFGPGFDLALIRALEEKVMNAAKSPNTHTIYAHRWEMFERWCTEAGFCALPASYETVKIYMAWALQVRRNRFWTVRVTLSAIADQHRRHNLSPDFFNDELKQFMVNCKRYLQEEQHNKAPLTPKQLKSICRQEDDRPISIRDRSILLIGFASGCRSDELASLQLKHVEVSRSALVLRLGRTKTDQAAKGRVVGIHYGVRRETCPVRALKAWLRVRGEQPGALYVNCKGNGELAEPITALDKRNINVLLKRALERIGVDPASYGSHSMRSGMVTAAGELGSPLTAIQQRTGHKRLESVLSYMRKTDALKVDPLRGLL